MKPLSFFAASAIALSVLCVNASEPTPIIAKHSIDAAKQPQAAIDSTGTIFVTFGANEDIYCCKSADRGKNFDKPIKVAQLKGLALGMRRGPRIVAGENVVVISAISHDDGSIVSFRSTDGGQSWHGPTSVNDSPASAREGLHAMAMSPDGDVYCVWLDLRNDSMQIYGAHSKDGGETWSENQQVYRSPDKSVCECCHPAVTYDSQNNLHIMWRNSVRGYRDMYRTVSKDGGKTFSKATKLGEASWELDACPMDGGYLAAIDPQHVTTVWRRGDQVYRTDSDNGQEQLLGPGEQPWAAASTAGVYVVWLSQRRLSQRQGELWLQTPQAKKPDRLSNHANDPMLATSRTGKPLAVAVWESGRGSDAKLMSQVISD